MKIGNGELGVRKRNLGMGGILECTRIGEDAEIMGGRFQGSGEGGWRMMWRMTSWNKEKNLFSFNENSFLHSEWSHQRLSRVPTDFLLLLMMIVMLVAMSVLSSSLMNNNVFCAILSDTERF